jgi:hypothetical protein
MMPTMLLSSTLIYVTTTFWAHDSSRSGAIWRGFESLFYKRLTARERLESADFASFSLRFLRDSNDAGNALE